MKEKEEVRNILFQQFVYKTSCFLLQYFPRSHHVVCVDMPGHEGTSRTGAEDYSTQGQVRRIHQVCVCSFNNLKKAPSGSGKLSVCIYFFFELMPMMFESFSHFCKLKTTKSKKTTWFSNIKVIIFLWSYWFGIQPLFLKPPLCWSCSSVFILLSLVWLRWEVKEILVFLTNPLIPPHRTRESSTETTFSEIKTLRVLLKFWQWSLFLNNMVSKRHPVALVGLSANVNCQ